MSRRAVSVLEVAHEGWWERLEALTDLHAHTVASDRPTARVVLPQSESSVLADLGDRVFVRYARRAPEAPAPREPLTDRIDTLAPSSRALLHRIQRLAVRGEVVGLQAWDPEREAEHVRPLLVLGLLEALPGDPHGVGRHTVAPSLPRPPEVAYDFEEAVFDRPDDLAPPRPGPAGILQDAASLAAAVLHVEPKRIGSGDLSRTDSKRLGRWLGEPALVEGAPLEQHPRWGLALRALEALAAVSMDPMDRVLRVDLGLERTLEGTITEAVHRFVCAVLDRDLHPLLPAVRAALRDAGAGAVDEVVFLDELRLQHRDVVLPPWRRDGVAVYPHLPSEEVRLYDEAGWERVEVPAVHRALRRLARIGLIQRAPGVFAATPDGLQWAAARDAPRPPIWVGSDLEIIVPPHALTPGQRFSVERLGRCVSRDVTDRIRLERESVERWLAWHDVDEAVQILLERAPGVPRGVVEALEAWQSAVCQVVLTRGVLIDLAE